MKNETLLLAGGTDILLLPETIGKNTSDCGQTHAHELMLNPLTESAELRNELLTLPIGQYGDVEATVSDETLMRMSAANGYIATVREAVLHSFADDLIVNDENDMQLFSSESDIDIGMFAQRYVIEQEQYPDMPILMDLCIAINSFMLEMADASAKEQHISSRAYKTAIAHVGAEIASWLYTYATDEQDKEMLHLWLAHFALVSGVLVGARTNASLIAFNPDAFPPIVTHDIHAIVMVDDPSALNLVGAHALFNAETPIKTEPVQYTQGGEYMRVGNLMMYCQNA